MPKASASTEPAIGGEKGGAARARPARRIGVVLAVFMLLTTGVVAAMFLMNLPLGERDKMEYRYTSVLSLRAMRTLPGWIGAGAALLGTWKLVRGEQRAGLAAGAVALAVLCGWTWWQPPEPAYQHVFNLMSPSHDGAFVLEAEKVGPMEPYLRRFGDYLRRTPEDVFGTRVLSNPPGMTVLSALVEGTLPTPVPDAAPERAFMAPDLEASQAHDVAVRIRMSFVLTAILAASGVFAYLLGREFLSPLGAAVFALLVTINPATANFSPGKDPAQLLTINAMMWLWFSGHRRQTVLCSALAGAVLVVGATFGLIHVWVALAAVLATAWKTVADGASLGRYVVARIVPAAVGAAGVVGVVYLATGWNIPLTLAAVAKRFQEIQYTIKFTRPLWAVIGLPLFLLFVSPAVFVIGALSRPWRVRRAGGATWGTCVLASTVAVMLVTYVIGVTYELPRLWIAFLPLLTLGACADWAVLRGRAPRPRVFQPVALLVAVHLVTTFVNVAMLDARESEYRMMQQKMFGEPSR
jgi:hypothetical protein